MSELVLVALAGFLATLVDGSLGMGFGPTSAVTLLGAGVSPATTSVTVNLAKVATGVASAGSHWRLGNVDRQLVVRLAAGGGPGAVLGAATLTVIDGATIRPWLAVLLLGIGLRLLARFTGSVPRVRRSLRLTRWAGFAGGATNSVAGAWGPVVTPFLLSRGVAPRWVAGSVNTAEVFVAVVSAGALVGSGGAASVELRLVLAMLGGGVLAAPLAAHVVRFVAPRHLGLGMAAMLVLSQSWELGRSVGGGDAAVGATLVAAILVATRVVKSAGSPGVGVVDERPDLGREPALDEVREGH